jgi:hypothetical protein
MWRILALEEWLTVGLSDMPAPDRRRHVCSVIMAAADTIAHAPGFPEHSV